MSLLTLFVCNYYQKTAALVLNGLACMRMRSFTCAGIYRVPTANQNWRGSLLALQCTAHAPMAARQLHSQLFFKAYQRYLGLALNIYYNLNTGRKFNDVVDFVPIFRGITLIRLSGKKFIALYIIFYSPSCPTEICQLVRLTKIP